MKTLHWYRPLCLVFGYPKSWENFPQLSTVRLNLKLQNDWLWMFIKVMMSNSEENSVNLHFLLTNFWIFCAESTVKVTIKFSWQDSNPGATGLLLVSLNEYIVLTYYQKLRNSNLFCINYCQRKTKQISKINRLF